MLRVDALFQVLANGPRISCGDSSACAQSYASFKPEAPSAACAC
jgi:hypothetical protein